MPACRDMTPGLGFLQAWCPLVTRRPLPPLRALPPTGRSAQRHVCRDRRRPTASALCASERRQRDLYFCRARVGGRPEDPWQHLPVHSHLPASPRLPFVSAAAAAAPGARRVVRFRVVLGGAGRAALRPGLAPMGAVGAAGAAGRRGRRGRSWIWAAAELYRAALERQRRGRPNGARCVWRVGLAREVRGGAGGAGVSCRGPRFRPRGETRRPPPVWLP
jgi:hypothetical protein